MVSLVQRLMLVGVLRGRGVDGILRKTTCVYCVMSFIMAAKGMEHASKNMNTSVSFCLGHGWKPAP